MADGGTTGLRLATPQSDHKKAFLGSFGQLTEKQDQFDWMYLGDKADLSFPSADFEGYVRTLLLRQTVAPDGFVCDTTYWALMGDDMVGRISLRHELNDFLRKVGGHIGYIVHPLWRRKGIAAWMLAEVLRTEKARSIGRLLITCDVTNIASEKTILKNGGVYTGTVSLGDSRSAKKHFWVDLTKEKTGLV